MFGNLNPDLCLAQPLLDGLAGFAFDRLVAGRIKFTDPPIAVGNFYNGKGGAFGFQNPVDAAVS